MIGAGKKTVRTRGRISGEGCTVRIAASKPALYGPHMCRRTGFVRLMCVGLVSYSVCSFSTMVPNKYVKIKINFNALKKTLKN